MPARDDEDVGVFFRRAGLLAFAGGLAPAGLEAAQAAACALFAAAVRVVHRVLGRAADRRTDAHPARAAGLADSDQAVLVVRDRADRSPSGVDDLADLGRRHLDMRIAGVIGDDLGEGAGRTDELCASAGLDLDIVDERADRDIFQSGRRLPAVISAFSETRRRVPTLTSLGRRT